VAVPELRRALQNGVPATRRQAAVALHNIGPQAKAALPELLGALDDADEKLRNAAALALGGLAKDAVGAVPRLVDLLQNVKETDDVRANAAWALAKIGPCPAAEQAISILLRVLGEPKNSSLLRDRTFWALRVHYPRLRDIPAIQVTLTNIVSEPKSPELRMLRYNVAWTLGMIWGPAAPSKTLDVLLEFLQDETVQLYGGTSARVEGTGTAGTTTTKEIGVGDARGMAIDALLNIGPKLAAARADVMEQLRRLAASAKDQRLRDHAKKALKVFGK
jgi:HEAT repeat protein